MIIFLLSAPPTQRTKKQRELMFSLLHIINNWSREVVTQNRASLLFEKNKNTRQKKVNLGLQLPTLNSIKPVSHTALEPTDVYLVFYVPRYYCRHALAHTLFMFLSVPLLFSSLFLFLFLLNKKNVCRIRSFSLLTVVSSSNRPKKKKRNREETKRPK